MGGSLTLQCTVNGSATTCSDTSTVTTVPPSTSLALAFIASDAAATGAMVTFRAVGP